MLPSITYIFSAIKLLVFIGTCCEDSQFSIPKRYAISDAAGFQEKNITLIGMDFNMTTHGNLTETLYVKSYPPLLRLIMEWKWFV